MLDNSFVILCKSLSICTISLLVFEQLFIDAWTKSFNLDKSFTILGIDVSPKFLISVIVSLNVSTISLSSDVQSCKSDVKSLSSNPDKKPITNSWLSDNALYCSYTSSSKNNTLRRSPTLFPAPL